MRGEGIKNLIKIDLREMIVNIKLYIMYGQDSTEGMLHNKSDFGVLPWRSHNIGSFKDIMLDQGFSK